MKNYLYAFLIVPMLLAAGCTPPAHMLVKDNVVFDIRSVKPEAGKSALVVARTTNFGGAIEFETYLNQKMIGVTQHKGYFVKTDVAPGSYYVVTKAENMEPAKIVFEPERIYYLLEVPRMGIWKARVSVQPLSLADLMSTIDDGCKYLEYDTKNPGDDLSEKDFKEAVADYEREVKEGLHQDIATYHGAPAK